MTTIVRPKNVRLDGLFQSNKVATIFVWGIWLFLLIVATICAVRYGRNLPLEEDWQLVPPLTGNRDDFGQFLWEQNNEHRIPLPKLLYFLLLKFSGGDFRIGMFFNVFVLGALSAVFIKTASKIRGNKTIFTDAFFPLALLHLGHWGNFYWSWQISFVIPTVLTCLQLSVIVQYKQLLSMRQALLLAVCTVLLPLCGINGLLYLLPIWPCLAYEGFLHFKNNEAGANRRVGILLYSAIALSVLVAVAYFIGYVHPPWNPPNPGLLPTIETTFKFLAMGIGPIASNAWGLFSVLVAIFLLTTGILLFFAAFRLKGVNARRAIGLLLFFGGYMGFALAMGYGRAAWVPMMGLPLRYVLLAVPPLIIFYYALELYGSSLLRKALQWTLFLLLTVLMVPNALATKIWRNWYSSSSSEVLRDIKAGVPESELFKRHQPFLLHWNPQFLLERMRQLKKAGMGPFKEMKDDPSNVTERKEIQDVQPK